MQVSLVNIGTSKGIRIPATVLKMFEEPTTFDLKVEDRRIVLDVIDNPRDGWKEKFLKYDEKLLIDDSLDIREWDEL